MTEPKIFISYSWKDMEEANKIDKDFQTVGINLIRDIRDSEFKDSFKVFMSNKVRETDYVLMVISDNFMKSYFCMYEVMELLKEKNNRDKILPIIISKKVNLLSIEYQISITKFWENEFNHHKHLTKGISPQNLSDLPDKLKHFNNICSNVGGFISLLSDMKSTPFDVLLKTNYKDIFEYIGYEDRFLKVQSFEILHIEDEEEKDIAISDFIEKHPNYHGIYFTKGIIELDRGRFKSAIKTFTKALNIKQEDALSYVNRGFAYKNLGKTDDAILDYNNALQINPNLIEALINRAACYSEMEHSRAMNDYNKVLEINNNSAEAYTGRAKIYNDLGKPQNAIEDCNNALNINPNNCIAYYNRAIAYMRLEKLGFALKNFNKALELNYEDNIILGRIYNDRGTLFSKEGKYYDLEKAKVDFIKAFELDPKNYKACLNLAWIYFLKKEFKEAIENYNKAIFLRPNYAKAYFFRGKTYKAIGEDNKAFNDLKHVLKIDPDFFVQLDADLSSYKYSNDNLEVIAETESQLEKDPNDYIALFNRGIAKISMGNHEEAIHDFNEVLNIKPDYAEAFLARGETYDKLKKFSSAFSDYNEALNINPEYAEAYYKRAKHFLKPKEYKKAINDYNKAISIRPDFVDAYFDLGSTLMIIDKHEQAINCFHKVLELESDSYDVYLALGICYRMMKQCTKAIDYFHKSLNINLEKRIDIKKAGETFLEMALCKSILGDKRGALEDFEEGVKHLELGEDEINEKRKIILNEELE